MSGPLPRAYIDRARRLRMKALDALFDSLRHTQTDSFALGSALFAEMPHAHKPAESTPDAARRQLTGLRQFLVDKDIVSIPGTEEAKVGDSPPYVRWNFAYISIPGPYEEDMPSTFGHVFVGYAFAEGWAHYTEAMMWDAGLGDVDPETHIGQLSNALLRNMRFLAAIGLHTKGMTIAEVEQLFVEEGYPDMATAKQQAARGTFDPEYLDYTMGKLMNMAMRSEWEKTHGGRAGWKAFHDQFLTYGGPSIPMVRRAMLGNAGPLFGEAVKESK